MTSDTVQSLQVKHLVYYIKSKIPVFRRNLIVFYFFRVFFFIVHHYFELFIINIYHWICSSLLIFNQVYSAVASYFVVDFYPSLFISGFILHCWFSSWLTYHQLCFSLLIFILAYSWPAFTASTTYLRRHLFTLRYIWSRLYIKASLGASVSTSKASGKKQTANCLLESYSNPQVLCSVKSFI